MVLKQYTINKFGMSQQVRRIPEKQQQHLFDSNGNIMILMDSNNELV